MGATNRDYMRDEPQSRGPAWGEDVPATKWLIIVTVGLFILQSIFTYPVGSRSRSFATATPSQLIQPVAMRSGGMVGSYLEDWLPLNPRQVLQGQIWRLVTFVFCHDRFSAWNLAFNMVALWYLGSTLERMYGSAEFLGFYLCAALACGLIFTGFGLMMELPFPLLGAEPCVLALLTLYATHFPRQEILFCWVIPIQIRILLMIYAAMNFYQIMQAYSGQGTWVQVAYLSQLWGIGFGYLYRQQKWQLAWLGNLCDIRRWRKSLRRVGTARNLKVFRPASTGPLDEQVDAILAKIHDSGSESLTDRERSILQKASERAKKRL
jgi:membrane associated rhomboid family serine protease